MLVEFSCVFHLQFDMTTITANICGESVVKTILEDQGVRIAVNHDL